MTSSNELAAVRAAVTDLERAVAALRRQTGESLGMRRLQTDVRRLAEDLDELGPAEVAPRALGASPTKGPTWPGTGLQTYPEGEDELTLHRDSDDEGIGGWRPHPLAAPPQ